jgi:Ca2+-binding EF-hand superfamily protein
VVTAAEFMDLMCKRIADKDPKDGIGKAFKLFE